MLQSPQGRVEIPTTVAIRYPGAFRVDARTPNGMLAQVFNGGEFWIQSEGAPAQTAPPQFADEMRGAVQRDSILMLLGLADGRLSATRLPDVTDKGRRLAALEVKAAAMSPVTVVLDPATWLIAGLKYLMPGTPGATMEEAFSDYRDVNGLKVAFKAVVSRDGAPFIERLVSRFDVNVPLDAGLFSRPS